MKRKIAVCIFWILVWQILSMIVGQTLLLPTPAETISSLGKLVISSSYWTAIFTSLIKILIGFISGAVIAIVLAAISASFSFVEEVLSPLFYVFRSTPVASFTVLVLVWVSADYLSVIISFIMVLPIIYSNVLTGIKEVDIDILEMAEVFQVPTIKKIQRIYIPYVLPYLLSALQTALGFAFKSGIAAEVIGHASHSIGIGIYNSKILLDTPALFAWTVTIILISYLVEKVAFSFIEKLDVNKGAADD